jgi:membrane protease YdiL (CAAX protease family)
VTRRTRLILWFAFVGLLIAISYAGRASAGRPAKDVLYQYGTAVSGLTTYALLLAVVVAIAGASRVLLGLRRPRSWAAALGACVVVFVGIIVVSNALDPFLHAGREQGLTPSGWDSHRAGQYAANFLVIAIVAPIVEELTYRGVGYSLLADHGRWTAIVVTGLLFGLSHGLVQALPVLSAFGFGLAWLRSRTESVYPGMLVHATFNALALALAVTV